MLNNYLSGKSAVDIATCDLSLQVKGSITINRVRDKLRVLSLERAALSTPVHMQFITDDDAKQGVLGSVDVRRSLTELILWPSTPSHD